jgi:hypothetical protein
MANDSERDALNEANLLGEESLGNFWPGSGLGVLMTLVEKAPEALPTVRIMTDYKQTIHITFTQESIRVSNRSQE